MLKTMRMARVWTLWLAVLAIGAVVPGWALAAGRVLTPQRLDLHQGRQPT